MKYAYKGEKWHLVLQPMHVAKCIVLYGNTVTDLWIIFRRMLQALKWDNSNQKEKNFYFPSKICIAYNIWKANVK